MLRGRLLTEFLSHHTQLGNTPATTINLILRDLLASIHRLLAIS